MVGLTRRRLIGIVVAIPLGIAFESMQPTLAQTIQPGELGEAPTTGGARPGSFGLRPATAATSTAHPVAIRIDKAQVDAQIEEQEIIEGVMQNPSGPWVVSWYNETSELGETGNIVMAGHLDYWDVGPAVFYTLGLLVVDDEIVVIGDDGQEYVYSVEWSEYFETATAPVKKIIGPTDEESLTLITCGGPFDYESGEYIQRLVVRAVRHS